ncbi:epsilon-lactone hydrolase [Microdochium nivale]|nr:epsilon-lactone hydrolase [Microdochium nivale]
MASWSALLVRLYVAWIRRSKAAFADADRMRALVAALYMHPQSYAPPKRLGGSGVVVDRIDVSEWPLYRVRAVDPAAVIKTTTKTTSAASATPRDAMLYIHGGGWIREAAAQHWQFAAQAARETGLDVLVPVYPLAPRPGATARHLVDGLVTIIKRLASTEHDPHSRHSHRIVSIAGDSAGGTIALATAQKLACGAATPDLAAHVRSLVLISPGLDCAVDHPDCLAIAPRDPWLGIAGLRVVAGYWAGGLAATDPLASPLLGEIGRLPPLLLLCGTDDVLCSDARRLSARFQGRSGGCSGDDASEGVTGSYAAPDGRFTYVEGPGMIHVYPLLPHWEGARARELILAFVRKHLE